MRTLFLAAGLLGSSFSLQAAAPDLEAVISLQAAKLRAAEARIAELKEATAVIPTLQSQVTQLQAANAAIPTLQGQLTQLQNSLNTLKVEVANNASRVEGLHNSQQASITNLNNGVALLNTSVNGLSTSLSNNYHTKATSDQRYLLATAFQSVMDRCFIQLGHSDRNFNSRERVGPAAKRNGEWEFVQLAGNVNEDDRIWFRFFCP